MELRRLRYFVALATHLHFSRAAEELGVAQPGLSQQIKVLERELNAVLINRAPGAIELTPAGRTLLEGATALLAQADLLTEQVRAAADGSGGLLRIAYTRTGADLAVGNMTREFRSLFPKIRVSAVTGWTSWNLEMLRDGKVDLAFVRGLSTPKDGIDLRVITEERSIVAVPAAHRLATNPTVNHLEIADEPVVMWARASGPEFYDALIAQVWPSRPPNLVLEEPEAEQVLDSVAAGTGISVLDERRARKLCPPGVVLVPFAERPPTVALSVAWRSNDQNKLITTFVTWCRDHPPVV